MKWLKDNKKLIVQFIKFGLVGVSNTVISLAVYYLLVYLGVHYIVANIFGFIISVLNAYYWNSKFVFKSDNSKKTILFRTYVAYLITFIISNGLLYIQVDKMGISKYIAPIICLLVTIPLNFIINKFWTYKEKK